MSAWAIRSQDKKLYETHNFYFVYSIVVNITKKNKIITGGSKKAGGKSKNIPEVLGYPITTIQKAILTKVN